VVSVWICGVGAAGSRVGCELYIWVTIRLCVSCIAWILALLLGRCEHSMVYFNFV
jgi:hypothetical protein